MNKRAAIFASVIVLAGTAGLSARVSAEQTAPLYSVSDKGAEKAVKNGWQEKDGVWYYLSEGSVQKGWQTIDGGKYYFDKNGKALTGWKKINGKTYYFNAAKKGRMVTGRVKIGGKTYTFGKDGVLESAGAKSTEVQNIPFGASVETIKKSVDTTGYEIIDEDNVYGYGDMRADSLSVYLYVFDDDDKMQLYVTGEAGNKTASVRKTFRERGYETKMHVEDTDIFKASDSIIFLGYDEVLDITYTLYVSPEVSREVLEGGFDPEGFTDMLSDLLE